MKTLIRLLSCVLLCSVLAACATQGKPGTPLPLPNKEIGEKWPPEVREFVDAMLTVFVDGKPTPSEQEVERALKIKLGEHGLIPKSSVVVNAKIAYWPLGTNNGQDWSDYIKMVPREDGRQSVRLSLSVDTARYCINPYDFAIYTGHHFMPAFATYGPHEIPPEPPHDSQGKPYGHDYVWGMFDRSPSYRYNSNGQEGNEDIIVSKDARCITWFRIGAFFKTPESISIKG